MLDKGETYSMKGTNLGEFEELVLLTVAILYEDAYGLAITDELTKQTGRRSSISSVHKVLVRLEKKGFLKSHMGGETEARGGRKKRLYTLTKSGVSVLNETKEIRNTMWGRVPQIVWDGGGF